MYEYMETGMENNTIQWGEMILIVDLSEDVLEYWLTFDLPTGISC